MFFILKTIKQRSIDDPGKTFQERHKETLTLSLWFLLLRHSNS